MFTATKARKNTKNWHTKAQTDHVKEYNRIKAKETAETEAMWPTHGLMWVKKIEGYIKTASARGHNGTYEPTTANPNGDQIIYIGEGNKPIYVKLMNHFRGLGYTVEEYQYFGMKITW